ncbi:MAG: sulfotransferase [Gemmatimonadota bacterium]
MNTPVFDDVAPIFVVGSARSGTTLLQLMLNSHSQLSVAGEVHFFDQICQVRREAPDLTNPSDRARFWSGIRRAEGLHKLPDVERVLAVVEERMKGAVEPSYELWYRMMLEEYARAKGASRFGEKTPQNVWYLREIMALFPRARVIEIVRDPRAVVASLVKVPFSSDDAFSNTLKWKCDVRFGAVAREHLRVRYEDLVADPPGQLQRICEYVGVPYEPKMLEYYQSAGDHVAAEPWKRNTMAPVQRESITQWEQELTPAHAALIETLTSSECLALGYPIPRRSLSLRLRALAAVPLDLRLHRQHVRRLRKFRETRPGMLLGTNARRFGMMWRMMVGAEKSLRGLLLCMIALSHGHFT